jgi:hypothetical protein
LKAGYSKYGADLPVSGGQGGSGGSGRGSKARKKAEALQREEFEYIVDTLIEEGYDLSSYTWNEMYDICEAVEQLEISPELIQHERMQRLSLQKRENRARNAGAQTEAETKAAAKVTENYHSISRKRMNKEEVDIFDATLST